MAALGSGAPLRAWRSASFGGTNAPCLHSRSPPTAACWPAANTAGHVKLWDVAAKTLRASLPIANGGLSQDETAALAFSPDGGTLAVAVDRAVQLWDVAADRYVVLLEGHEGKVQCLAYSPDGRLLASGGYDQTVRLWDMARYRALSPRRR